MNDVTVIGIDIAKNVIQIHGADKHGKRLIKKRVSRDNFLPSMANLPKCLVGMEACGGSHYWARKLMTLGFEVKLMSPKKVKKYVDGNKNDMRDAQACAEAVTRGSMQFVSIRTQAQLDIQTLHRVRSHYVGERTALMNMMRGFLLDAGIAIPKGQLYLEKKLVELLDEANNSLDAGQKTLFGGLREDLKQVDSKVVDYTSKIEKLAKGNDICQRLETIEGIGPLTSSAIVAKIGNGSEFQKGRDLSAYLGLVPKQASSGEKEILLGITKTGDRYIRQLLVHGGRSCLMAVQRKNKKTGEYTKNDPHSLWMRKLAERVGMNKASVAVANKNARMIVAVLKNKTVFSAELAHCQKSKKM